MSEARALTNFAGNSIATVLIGRWTGGLDAGQLDAVLSGDRPFDEATMLDEPEVEEPRERQVAKEGSPLAASSPH